MGGGSVLFISSVGCASPSICRCAAAATIGVAQFLFAERSPARLCTQERRRATAISVRLSQRAIVAVESAAQAAATAKAAATAAAAARARALDRSQLVARTRERFLSFMDAARVFLFLVRFARASNLQKNNCNRDSSALISAYFRCCLLRSRARK